MAKYSEYIALSPHYESVVDINSDERNPNMWHDYIVHEDMEKAMEKICESFKYESQDQRRSFWIHGAYGTGKSYAAIVIKHLFEDSQENVYTFLSKPSLIPFRDRFMSLREKGDYLVIWESQATDIRSSTQLLMKMERAIRDRLAKKYGDKAYYGRTSLITVAQAAIKDSSVNWQGIFDDPTFGLQDDYGKLAEFVQDVEDGVSQAVNRVASIYREKGWGFLQSLEDFKAWIKDIIKGNHLAQTGIVFIWDEFTTYLRNNPNDDVLQPLSEFCKVSPFFMFLIVHRSDSWIEQIGGEETYDRIVHRFHSLDFHVSESAAYELIGNSIIVRAGMEDQWNQIVDMLMHSIQSSLADFDHLDISSKTEKFRNLCPIHPMTLSLLAVVAQNFGASQRTLFRFMKDVQEGDQEKVGFTYYIKNFGPDDWRWLTCDFLWDYFFLRESDVHSFSKEAKDAYQHYMESKDSVSDAYHLHVFKAAMLLIAVVASGNISNLYSQAVRRKVAATKRTLYKCFVGKLSESDIDQILTDLENINLLRMDTMRGEDMRIQIPYKGMANVFDVHREENVKKLTRYVLFKKNGVFAKSMEDKIWDKTRASYNRMVVAVADSGTKSIEARLKDVQEELKKHSYKFGILAISIEKPAQFASLQEKVKDIARKDKTKRLAVYLLKSPLTKEHLDRYYTAITNAELAADEGKSGDAARYGDEAKGLIEEWSAPAADDQVMAVYQQEVYPMEFGCTSMARKLENDIIFGRVFSAAPEHIVLVSTAFKKGRENAAKAGIKKESPDAQIRNIVNGLKACQVFDLRNLNELAQATGNPGANAIAQIAKFLQKQFMAGTQIKLDVLWSELQAPPFGYYNALVCSYLLGFMLREYVNSEFTWNHGDNNPWMLTIDNLSTLIKQLMAGEVINNYLSPGSEIWQSFKPYVEKVFRLSDNEAVNETEARKYMAKQCIEEAGVPFWVLHYVSMEKFGGKEQKKCADEIIDLFSAFLHNDGQQEHVMSDITTRFKGHGKLRLTLEELYFDRNEGYLAFRTFCEEKSTNLMALMKKLGITNGELLDSMHHLLPGQVSDWTEKQVETRFPELEAEYRAVISLNSALGVSRKNMQQLREDLRNAFNHMKLPSGVIEQLKVPWLKTLRAMQDVVVNSWSMIDSEMRGRYAKLFEQDGEEAWENVILPKTLLQQYLSQDGESCTQEELDTVYQQLEGVPYSSPATDFKRRLKEALQSVAYSRNKKKLQALWEEQSGMHTVHEWCDHFFVPIQWVSGDEGARVLELLADIQADQIVNASALAQAVDYFSTHDLSFLREKKQVHAAFFRQVGEEFRQAFAQDSTVLIARLKTDSRLTSDVYHWANKVGIIREIIQNFQREKYLSRAKQEVIQMPEKVLKKRVVELLEEKPNLATLFMK